MDRATLIYKMRRIAEMESIGVKMSQKESSVSNLEPSSRSELSDDDLDLSQAFHTLHHELPENIRTLENPQAKRKRRLFDEHY